MSVNAREVIKLNGDSPNQMVGKLEMWKAEGDLVAIGILEVATKLSLPTEKLNTIAEGAMVTEVRIADDPEEFARQFEAGKERCLNQLKQLYIDKVTGFETIEQSPNGGMENTTINVNKFNRIDGSPQELTLNEKFDLAKQRYKEKYGTDILSLGAAWYDDFNMNNQGVEMSKNPVELLEFPVDASVDSKLLILKMDLQFPEKEYNYRAKRYLELPNLFDSLDGEKFRGVDHRKQKLYQRLCNLYTTTVESQLDDRVPKYNTKNGEKLIPEQRMLEARKMVAEYKAMVQ